MKKLIRIEDYFISESQFLKKPTSTERNNLYMFRDELNRCITVQDQVNLIKEWRGDNLNVIFDRQVLGIDRFAVVYPYSNRELNKVVKYQIKTQKEKEEAEQGQEIKNKKKTPLIRFLIKLAKPVSIIGAVISLLATFWKYGGYVGAAFGIVGLLHSTPFGHCLINLDTYEMAYTKSLVDNSGAIRFIPGNGFQYGGYEEEREKIINGYYEESPKDLNNDGDTDDGLEEDHYHKYKNFTTADWVLPEEQRGIGTFGELNMSNMRLNDLDPQCDYVISMRWEYMPWFINGASSLDAEDPKPSRYEHPDKLTQSVNHPEEPIDADIDYCNWLLQQKIIVMNPINNKSVICVPGDDQSLLWGPANTQRLGLLSKRAIIDLDYDTSSDVELEVYFIPEDIAQIQTGLLDTKMKLYTEGCEYSSLTGINPIPPVGITVDGDWGQNAGVVGSKDTDWRATISPQYWALLVKYGMTSKEQATACASYVSIMLAEKYGDIKPTASTANLMNQIKNHPNYTNTGKFTSVNDLQPGAILLRTNGNGYKYGHTYIYTGDSPYNAISASLNSHGPVYTNVGGGKSDQLMFVFYRNDS